MGDGIRWKSGFMVAFCPLQVLCAATSAQETYKGFVESCLTVGDSRSLLSFCSAHTSRSLRWSGLTPSSSVSLPGCGGLKWEPMTRESVLGMRRFGPGSLSPLERLCWAWTSSGEHREPFRYEKKPPSALNYKEN